MTELENVKLDKKRLTDTTDIFQPLDYSFMSIKNLADLPACDPRILTSTNLEIKKSRNGKWISQTFKVNNNHIEDITSLPSLVNELFDNVSNLIWLDMSCNNIAHIPNSLGCLKHLKIIYLHGNLITTFQEVIKLKQLPYLSKLTLHGNPVEKERVINYSLPCINEGYFHTVLSILPNLITLDFTGISRADKQTAALVRRPGQNKQ
ncbi:Dynein regulatory complex subunit 3 [Schistosoma japonicum]|nr:Dynein regulatory complex subunit 3 [Schistosoma japonicum]